MTGNTVNVSIRSLFTLQIERLSMDGIFGWCPQVLQQWSTLGSMIDCIAFFFAFLQGSELFLWRRLGKQRWTQRGPILHMLSWQQSLEFPTPVAATSRTNYCRSSTCSSCSSIRARCKATLVEMLPNSEELIKKYMQTEKCGSGGIIRTPIECVEQECICECIP